MAKKFLSREEYVNQQRQAIIEQSLENSNNRINPAVPYILKYTKQEWLENINNLINSVKLALDQAIKYNHGEEKINEYKKLLSQYNNELKTGYKPELCAGDSCIYTATDNYGKKYRVSGNQSFRANPAKYGFKEINLNDIKPGDIIQDFSFRDNTPHHAITFIGYDDNNKALFNYSKGGSTEEDIVKNGHYPFYWDDEIGKVHFDSKNNDKLRHTAAAYRFIGTEDDNKLWNENYNKERSNWSKKVVEELKHVPIIQLPNRVVSMKKYGGKQKQNSLQVKNGIAQPLGKGYYLMSGATHEQGGIDIGKNLEVENGEIIKLNPKSIKVLSNAPIMGDMTPAEYALGGLKDGTFEDRYNKGFKYQEKFKDINGLNDDGTKKAKWGIIKNIINKFTMGGEDDKRDLLGDVIMKNNIQDAIDSLGIDEVRRRLYRGFSPIGYDNPYERFKSAMSNKEERRKGDELVNDIWAEYLQIPKEERYKPASQFVVESGDVSPNAINNKINHTLTPFRKHLLSDIMRIGEKLNIGKIQTCDSKLFKKGHGLRPFEFRNFTIGRGRDNKGDYVSYYDLWDLNPLPLKGIITNGKDAFEETGVGTPIDFYDKIYLDDYYELNEEDKGNPWITPSIVTAINPNNPNIRKRDRKKIEKENKKELGGQMKNKYKFGGKATIPSTGEKKKAYVGTTYFPKELDFSYLNRVNTSPYTKLNVKTGEVTYPKIATAKVVPTVTDTNPNKINANIGDWINLGTNVLGAIGNLAVRHGYRQDPIIYPNVTPISPVKLKTRYNINPRLQKLARTVDKYKDAIAKNTASSQTSLNRLRNLNLEELDRVNYLYGEKYSKEIPLINSDRMNFQNVMENNIGRQEAVDRYNIQSRITTNNLNKMERAAALVDFAQAIPQISENFVGTIEKRNQFNKNLATIGLGYPDIDVEKLLSIIRG